MADADKVCYLCGVDDPNEVHFDHEKHDTSLVCGVKIWEMAKQGAKFDVRDSTVVIKLKGE